MPSVLIVDDLPSIHEMLEAVIQPTGFSTAFATDGEKALARYKEEKFDLVLTDIDMKPMDGIAMLRNLKMHDPSAVVIIMTAYASTESAIKALKFGAFDYLQKPFKVDELIKTLKRGMEFKQASVEKSQSGPAPVKNSDIENRIIGKSPAVKRLIQQVKKLLGAKTPVLLQGEVGTGKRAVAEILHASSGDENAPFTRIDCALSSAENFRSGLLGENGAGGTLIGETAGGTLFLDNIHCLPLEMQGELVSVLRNTGSSFRLVCTSVVDLEVLVDEGKFNDELFYRVAALPVSIPPLRDRVEDIPLLLKHVLLHSANPQFETNQMEFTKDAMQTLTAYYWPGNVAEFNQVISKVVSTTDSRVINSKHLPLRLHDLTDWPSLADYLAGQEAEYVQIVLHACNEDRERAAAILKCAPEKLA